MTALRPSHGARARRRVAAAALGLALVAAAACGDGASGQDAGGAASSPLTVAADAPAATGSGLDDRPGPEERTQLDGFDEVAVAVVDTDGTVGGWCALLAATAEQRQRGLMEVVELDGYVGMLFVAEQEELQSFWMRNTVMPLSIAWFDDEGRFVSARDMEPCEDGEDCPLHGSGDPARFALEVPQGELPGMGIGPGSTLQVGGTCA